MTQAPKNLSLAHIHDVYNSGVSKREPSQAKPNYKTTQRFARDAGHPGIAPTRPLPPGTRRG
jgi:hypothetical protein